MKPTVKPSVLGVLGGGLAGFPNGRRVFDDVFTIELRAIAGATIPLVDPTFSPDGAALVVTDGVEHTSYLSSFPYLGLPSAATTCRADPTMSSEEPIARPHPEHAVLDVGGDIGALVVQADAADHDPQIEICRSGQEAGKREHQHILERPVNGARCTRRSSTRRPRAPTRCSPTT